MTPPAFPPGSCDTHIHIYDARHPVDPRSILRPPDASVADYRLLQSELGLERVVVVQPSTYGADNRCQLEAVAAMGGHARAVVVVDGTVGNGQIAELTARGARAARFHMLPGGVVPWGDLELVARRIADDGWHVQLQLNGRELASRLEMLRLLPVPLVVDHVGRFMPPVAVNDPSFVALLALVETGRCWVKLSAPYESSVAGPPGYDDLRPLVASLVATAPERMLWASNWPHPGRAAPPAADLANLFESWVPDPETRHRILVDNPARLYGFEHPTEGHTDPPREESRT
ncbi:MAG: amidohydrolase family protein [Acidimicrobiia bacterium]